MSCFNFGTKSALWGIGAVLVFIVGYGLFCPFATLPWQTEDRSWSKAFFPGYIALRFGGVQTRQASEKQLMQSLEVSLTFPANDLRRNLSFSALTKLAASLPTDTPGAADGFIAADKLLDRLKETCHKFKLDTEAGCKAVQSESDYQASIPW